MQRQWPAQHQETQAAIRACRGYWGMFNSSAVSAQQSAMAVQNNIAVILEGSHPASAA